MRKKRPNSAGDISTSKPKARWTDGSKAPVYLSGRNVPHINVLPFSDATAYDILHADALVIESAALGSGVNDGNEAPAPKAMVAKPVKKAAVKKASAKAVKTAKPKAAKHAPSKVEGKAAAKKPAKKKESK